MTERDASPVRAAPMRTEFYKCRNTGGGWSITKTSHKDAAWVHFQVEYDTAMQPLGTKTALAEFRKALELRLKSTPFYSVVFEYDLMAPSEIILVVWVGMHAPKKLPQRNIIGRYMADCRWPDDMTREQYKKTQQY